MRSAIPLNSWVLSLPFSMTEMFDSLRNQSRVRYTRLANGMCLKIHFSRSV